MSLCTVVMAGREGSLLAYRKEHSDLQEGHTIKFIVYVRYWHQLMIRTLCKCKDMI